MLQSVEFIDKNCEILSIDASRLGFAYDYSDFHHLDAFILSVTLKLKQGDGKKGLEKVAYLAKMKAHHPPNSLGCIFQNLSSHSQKMLNLPTNSSGYLIDKVLQLGQLRIGNAQVSPKHAGFIENIGHATSDDYLKIIKTITGKAKTQLGIDLKSEIFYRGFNQTELAGLNTNSDNISHE